MCWRPVFVAERAGQPKFLDQTVAKAAALPTSRAADRQEARYDLHPRRVSAAARAPPEWAAVLRAAQPSDDRPLHPARLPFPAAVALALRARCDRDFDAAREASPRGGRGRDSPLRPERRRAAAQLLS